MLGRLLRTFVAGPSPASARPAAASRPVDAARHFPLAWSSGRPRTCVRSRSELLAENALLRQQLIVLGRTAKRPRLTRRRSRRSSCCWPAGSAPGGRPCSSSARRRCCAGTGRVPARSGGGSRARGPAGRASRRRRSP